MRPLYESDQDRSNEAEVARQISQAWGCFVRKLDATNSADYLVEKDGYIVALLEIKCRNYSFDQLQKLGGLFISKQKIDRVMLVCVSKNIWFTLAIRLPDGIYALSAKEWPAFEVVRAGRRDRNDPADIEQCYLIPMDYFGAII
jgi:hypothetical protein